LRASLLKEGFTADIIDFNVRLKEKKALRRKIMEWSQYVHGYNFFLGILFPEYLTIEEDIFTREVKGLVRQWADEILDSGYNFIGFTIYNSSALLSLLLAREIKQESDEALIVFGGPDCALWMRGDFFIRTGFVEAVVLGEGEATIVELADSLVEGGDGFDAVAGSLINRKGEVIYGGDRPLIKDLDTIPFPNFDELPIASYGNEVIFPFLTSRGCTMNCSFCNEQVYWSKYRERSPINVFNELKYQKERHGVFHFRTNDSLINGNIKRLGEICDLIIENDLEVYWGGYARTGGMTPELLEKMYGAGCRYLLYGIDSASQPVIDRMKKRTKIEDMQKVLGWTRKAGILVHTCWITGFPTERQEDFEASVKFIKENANVIDSFVVVPCRIKESIDLYNNPEDYNLVIDKVEVNVPEPLADMVKYLPLLSENWKSGEVTNEERQRRTKVLTDLARDLIGEGSYYRGMPFE